MTPSPQAQARTPDLKRLLGRLLNKHYAMAADEYKEGASDSSVKKHYDEARDAENEFTAALDALETEASELREQNGRLRELLDNAFSSLVVVDCFQSQNAVACGYTLQDSRTSLCRAKESIVSAIRLLRTN